MIKLTLSLIGLILTNNLFGQVVTKVKIFDKDAKIVGFSIVDYERFSPNAEEYEIADSLAKIHVIQNSSKFTYNGKPINAYHDYYKQVYGWIDKSGDKIIFMNCFCSIKDHEYWKDITVSVKGGGKCYFSVKVNLTDFKVFDFWINAPK